MSSRPEVAGPSSAESTAGNSQETETAFSLEQYELCYPPGIEWHWWTLARNYLLARELRRATAAGDVLLEVGCGRGIVVDYLRRQGLDVRGVELAAVPCLPGLEGVVQTGADATALPPALREQVRGLLLLDVIEHIESPDEFLSNLLAHFPNASLVIFTVPAREELWSNYDGFYGHFRRYTLPTLADLAVSGDWHVTRCGYFFRMPYVPMRLMAALGMDRQTYHLPPGPLARPLHRLVAALCDLEQRCLPGALPGASAYAVFRSATG